MPWSLSLWIFNAHPEPAHFFGFVPMSLSSSDTLQLTSALHQEETERITGQKSRDWDRVKAIPYCREQQAFRGTLSLQTALAGGHRSHCCRYESITLSRSAPSKNSHVHNRTHIYIRYQRTREVRALSLYGWRSWDWAIVLLSQSICGIQFFPLRLV